MTRRHLFCIPLFLLVLMIGLGCGSKKTASGKIYGKVTYNGAPVTGGDVAFHSDVGGYSTGITPEGTYQIGEIPPCDAVVTIHTEALNPNVKKQTYTGQTKMGPKVAGGGGGKMKGEQSSPIPDEGKNTKGAYVKIPAIYSDKTKSPLKFKVTGESQEINLELKDG